MDSFVVTRLIADRNLLGDHVLEGVGYIQGFPAPESTEYYRMMRAQGFSHADIIGMIDEMEADLNNRVAEHLRMLMDQRHASVYRMEKAGLSGRMIKNVLAGKTLSKDTLFGICLFLELSEDEVEAFLRVRGIRLTDYPTDVTFRNFIQKGIYKIADFVDACWYLADEAGIKLPEFYERGYQNITCSREK